MTSLSSALLPDASQMLLCRAALMDGDEARASWRAWRASGGTLDALDYPTQSVLPMLYKNMNRLAVDDPDIGRLKGAYRRCWFENQHVLGTARHGVMLLHEEGVATMLCKGAALIVAEGRDAGARPMGDVDVVVAPDEARRALEILVGAGYVPTGGIEPYSALRVRRGLNLAGPDDDGGRLDLHWTSLPAPDPSPEVFGRCRPTSLLGVPTLAPCPTDALLTILAHGTSWDPAPVRWVLDACFLLSVPGVEIDWSLFVRRARGARFAWPVGVALATLRTGFGCEVPSSVVDELARARGGVVARALWTVQQHHLPRGQRWPYLVNEWRKTRSASYPGGEAGGLVSFVAARLQATSGRDLAGRIRRHEAPWV